MFRIFVSAGKSYRSLNIKYFLKNFPNILVEHPIFCRKAKFGRKSKSWSKIKILVGYPKFLWTSKILVENQNFGQTSKFFVEKQHFGQTSKLFHTRFYPTFCNNFFFSQVFIIAETNLWPKYTTAKKGPKKLFSVFVEFSSKHSEVWCRKKVTKKIVIIFTKKMTILNETRSTCFT